MIGFIYFFLVMGKIFFHPVFYELYFRLSPLWIRWWLINLYISSSIFGIYNRQSTMLFQGSMTGFTCSDQAVSLYDLSLSFWMISICATWKAIHDGFFFSQNNFEHKSWVMKGVFLVLKVKCFMLCCNLVFLRYYCLCSCWFFFRRLIRIDDILFCCWQFILLDRK